MPDAPLSNTNEKRAGNRPAPPSNHRSSARNPPCPCPTHPAAKTLSASDALGITHRRRAIAIARTEVPARQSADSAAKNPAPDAQRLYTRTSHHAGEIYPASPTIARRDLTGSHLPSKPISVSPENPPLNRLLPIRHIGQSAPFTTETA